MKQRVTTRLSVWMWIADMFFVGLLVFAGLAYYYKMDVNRTGMFSTFALLSLALGFIFAGRAGRERG